MKPRFHGGVSQSVEGPIILEKTWHSRPNPSCIPLLGNTVHFVSVCSSCRSFFFFLFPFSLRRLSQSTFESNGFHHPNHSLGVYLGHNRLDSPSTAGAQTERIAVHPGRLFLNGGNSLCARTPRLGPCRSHMGNQQYDYHVQTHAPFHT